MFGFDGLRLGDGGDDGTFGAAAGGGAVPCACGAESAPIATDISGSDKDVAAIAVAMATLRNEGAWLISISWLSCRKQTRSGRSIEARRWQRRPLRPVTAVSYSNHAYGV